MNAYGFLTKEAAIRSTIQRIEQQPGYMPKMYARAGVGIKQLRQYMQDLNDILMEYKGEGDS